MRDSELLAAAMSYATVAGRAVGRRGEVPASVAYELSALNARDPRAALRLRDLYATWPSTTIIEATAMGLLRQRWQRDPATFDGVFAALHEQLAPLRAPARTVVSRRPQQASQVAADR